MEIKPEKYKPYKNKKVLLVGLGILGGGEAIAKFFLSQEANLTITDLRNRKTLAPVIKRLKSKKIKLVLGKHRPVDFKNNDLIVFNPAVSIFSPWAKLAKEYKKPTENDLTLFLKLLEIKRPNAEYIAITGTRGKTTSSLWINHFLSKSVLGGNQPDKGLLVTLEKRGEPFVLELSSSQLEFSRKGQKSPKIAVITNLYNDHLNRYGNIKRYLEQKAKIFLNQTENDFLILNTDNKHTKEFLKSKPKSKIYYLSLRKLPNNKQGLYFIGNKIYFKENSGRKMVHKINNLADHQKYNLLTALLSSYLYGKSWKELIRKIKSLPQPSFRQELVFKNDRFEIINDSAATSPDGTIAAIDRFNKKNKLVLIAGGTDKMLNFSDLAEKIKKDIEPKNLFLLEGSATRKLTKELSKNNYFGKRNVKVFDSFTAAITSALRGQSGRKIILFSPAAASFEKFKNEYDRGRQFNKIIEKSFVK